MQISNEALLGRARLAVVRREEICSAVDRAHEELTTGYTSMPERTNPLDVRRVICVLGSSRGGTSLLFSLLRSTGYFASLRGEHTHLYKRHGLGLPDDTDSHDGHLSVKGRFEDTAQGILAEASFRDVMSPQNINQFQIETMKRLILQWPHLSANLDDVQKSVKCAFDSLKEHDAMIWTVFQLSVIKHLREYGHEVNPWYYDIAPQFIRAWFPNLPKPQGPPLDEPILLEEPPFVVGHPTQPLTSRPKAIPPLLLKASIDAYRFETITKLFPCASVRVIHLVRNPAAAINGLIDGWLDRGFYSHNLSDRAQLGISGYSHQAWGRDWWNFDLPPGWKEFADKPLPDVCGLQWRQAHENILSTLGNDSWEAYRIHAEDLQAGGPRRDKVMRDVLEFCAAPLPNLSFFDHAAPIMMTKEPRPARWRENAKRLESPLRDSQIRELSSKLGYGSLPTEAWS